MLKQRILKSMTSPPKTDRMPAANRAGRGRVFAGTIACVTALLAGFIFWSSRPSVAEQQLIGIWRSQVEGASNSELVRFDKQRRLTGFKKSSGVFEHHEGYWSVQDGKLHIERGSSNYSVVRTLENLWKKVTTTGGPRTATSYDVEWHDDDSCTIVWKVQGPNEKPLTIHLERVKSFDPSRWDDRGHPMPSSPVQVR